MLLGLTGLENGLLYSALSVFGGASIVALRVMSGRRKGRRLPAMLAVGVGLLTVLLLLLGFRLGRFPIGQRFHVLLIAAWALGVGAWWISRRYALPVLAAIAAPTLALLTFFSVLVVPTAVGDLRDTNLGLLAHILLACLGFMGFTISAGVGVLYLRQIRLMKRDPTAALKGRLPSLERLDTLNYYSAAFGFPNLALSVLAGWLFVGSEREAQWLLDPTVMTACAGLGVYLALFAARGLLGWYGRRIAVLSVVGFVVTVVGYVVATFCTSQGLLHTG